MVSRRRSLGKQSPVREVGGLCDRVAHHPVRFAIIHPYFPPPTHHHPSPRHMRKERRMHATRLRCPAPRGFGLLELVVVIGILGLLVSFLMPSLCRSRETASRIKCAILL